MSTLTRSVGALAACWVLVMATAFAAQTTHVRHTSTAAPPDYSGTYSFLKEGEFVQLTVEDRGRVTGFISRYGDLESDRGVLLDHFFKSAKIEGTQLTFLTDTIHGVSFEFRGTIERGEGKIRSDEAYYVLRGTLLETSTDEAHNASARSRQVTLKSTPRIAALHSSKHD
jgi:hypothetical protein